MNRRAMLKTTAAAALGLTVPYWSRAQVNRTTASLTRTLGYLDNLAHPDGGYAWHEETWPHLTPTFAAVGCYQALGQTPPNKARVAEFIRTHHPARLKKLEQEHRDFEFQQIQALVWLGEDVSSFRAQVSGWKKPRVYLKQYEQHGWPVFRHELAAFTCRALVGLPLDDLTADYVPYLESRRRPNGSFNGTPASEGGDGHVLNTWWGLQALRLLNREGETKKETIAWLKACQLPGGGFTWQPEPEFAGTDDLAYMWAAVHALDLLGARPEKPEACVEYVLSLENADGGFGDRPGWRSNPVATYYALDTLLLMGALGRSAELKRPAVRTGSLPSNLKVCTVQIEAHGQGSPSEAVDLAGSLGIHLWGAKNAAPKWIAAAQAIATRRKVPVQFFVANEEHGTWVHVPGLGTYSHTSDIIAPGGAAIGNSLTTAGAVSWLQYREQRLAPLLKGGGRLIWQFGENEELVRLFLDDSVARRGYAAISTYHFGNPDFTNSEQFLLRYRGQIPFVALQDAHGEEPWWFADMTTGFRTLFLANEPTWEGWLKALENDWVAAVRRDSLSGDRLWMHAGRAEVLEFVRRHESVWRWWDNEAIKRPMVSIVAVRPDDEFEAGRPQRGTALRVRCAWENTTQGLPKAPLAELVKLTLDGVEVSPELVKVSGRSPNTFKDYYHKFQLPQLTPGKHTATALVRVPATGETLSRNTEFVI